MILIAGQIQLSGFIFVERPVIVHVKFVIVSAWFQFQVDTPIFLDSVEFHFLELLPLVPTAHHAHVFGSRDDLCFVGDGDLSGLQELGIDKHGLECLSDVPVIAPELSLLSDLIRGLFALLFCVTSTQSCHLFLYSVPIDIHFVLEPIKLCVPAFGHIFFLDYTVIGILTNLLVPGLVSITLHGSSHAPFEVLLIVRHEIESIALLGFGIKLENSVFQSSRSKANDWGASAEKFMLDDSSWFEQRRH